MAECGGLLNHLGLFRSSHFSHLQSGNDHLSRANVLSFGSQCSPLCSPAKARSDSFIRQLLCSALCSKFQIQVLQDLPLKSVLNPSRHSGRQLWRWCCRIRFELASERASSPLRLLGRSQWELPHRVIVGNQALRDYGHVAQTDGSGSGICRAKDLVLDFQTCIKSCSTRESSEPLCSQNDPVCLTYSKASSEWKRPSVKEPLQPVSIISLNLLLSPSQPL